MSPLSPADFDGDGDLDIAAGRNQLTPGSPAVLVYVSDLSVNSGFVQLVNTGTAATTVTGLSISSNRYSHTAALPLVVPARDSVSVNVLYKVNTGTKDGTLTIASDASDNPSITVQLREGTFSLVTDAVNGAVTLNPPGGTYAPGTVVTVTATPNSGYSFTEWSGDLAGISNPATLTMDSDKSIVANFSTSAFQQSAAANHLVSIEAERYETRTTAAGHSWDVVSSSGYSGGRAMKANPDNGANVNTGYVTGSPMLTFKVNFVRTGVHYIWARGVGPGVNADSYHFGLNGAAIASCDRIDGFTTTAAWSRRTLDGPVATFTVTSAGVHTLNVWMREDGFILDKIVLTSSSTYTPTGTGPAESPRPGTFRISASEGANGMVLPAGIINVAAGASQTFDIVPSPGYVVDQVVVDGVNQGALRSFTFSNVVVNHTLSATFKPDPAIPVKLNPTVRAWSPYQEPNAPANTLDGDLSTRWSSFGVGQWVTYDLGAEIWGKH